MKINSKDSFKSLKKLKVDNKIYNIFSLEEAEKNGLEGISKLPKSIILCHIVFSPYLCLTLARSYADHAHDAIPIVNKSPTIIADDNAKLTPNITQ